MNSSTSLQLKRVQNWSQIVTSSKSKWKGGIMMIFHNIWPITKNHYPTVKGRINILTLLRSEMMRRSFKIAGSKYIKDTMHMTEKKI